MFKNYLIVALRSLTRGRLHSLISIFGLSVGLACCLLIFLYVRDELSFDRFHKKEGSIYRLIRVEEPPGEEPVRSPSVTKLIAPELLANFPQVVNAVRITDGSNYVVSRGENSFTESVIHIDPGFFKMLSFSLLQGSSGTVLNDPKSAVITPEIARKYFGDENPIGKTLSLILGAEQVDVKVTGVVNEAPGNSSIQYNILIPLELLNYVYPERMLDSWNISIMQTLLELEPGVSAAEFEGKLTLFTRSLFSDGQKGSPRRYLLQPLTDIHLNPMYDGLIAPNSNPVYSYILSAIALAVLLIACINFTTLAVGRSASRTREVGLRKALGAQRGQLMKQFWGESLLLTLIAMMLGIVLAELFLPAFNNLAQKRLELTLSSGWSVIPALAGLTIVTAFVSGVYPAALLSSLAPAAIFRGKIKIGGGSLLIRGMVVFQFTISVFLILTTFIISSQMKYMRGSDLGYNRDSVVTIPLGTDGEEAERIVRRCQTELGNHNGVVDVAGCAYGFGESWLRITIEEDGLSMNVGENIRNNASFGQSEISNPYFYINWVDHNYIPTMRIELLKGRNFSPEYPSDRDGAIIVNQAAVKAFGWENPLGQKLPRGFKDAVVVGVVKDFHYYPLHRKIEPLVFHITRNGYLSSYNHMAARIDGNDIPGTLKALETAWKKIAPGMPFSYEFIDDRVAEQYAAELRWRSIVRYSTVFSLLIACLGLFGLTSLAASKRTREIGIRKVLGAATSNILRLMSRQFIVMVIIANIVAAPLAWIVMNRWLRNFAYRTEIEAWIFLMAVTISVAVALIAVSYHSLKAAAANPVESLRYE